MLFTFIDVETTGLDTHNDDVLSFSFATYESSTREIIRSDTLYFYKKGITKWNEEAYQVHLLSQEFLEKYEPDFDANMRLMYAIIHDSIFVGFNSGRLDKDGNVTGFDFNVIKNFLGRNGYPVPNVEAFIDLLQVSRKYIEKEGQKFRLQTLVDHLCFDRDKILRITEECFSEGVARAHDSGYDVVCTILLFDYLYTRKMIHFVRASERYKPKSANDFSYRIIDGELIAILKTDDSVQYNLFQLYDYERMAFTEKFPFLL